MIILGLDPSFRNWGIALMNYTSNTLTLLEVKVIQTKPHKKSKLSKALQDLQDAQTLLTGVLSYALKADVVVIELPLGSQSAAAMKSYGICIGLAAALNQLKIPFYYVNPFDVKRVVGSTKTTKEEIIEWVNNRHPNILDKAKCRAEHQADACIAIYAALNQIKELNQ